MNITEHKQADELLRESEARWRLSIENMLDAYVLHEAIYDKNGRMVDYRFVEINPAAEKILGMARKHIVGRTAQELFPSIVERGLMGRYADVMTTGRSALIEDFYYTGDMLDKAFDISCFRIDAIRFVCLFRDVTERKKTEAKLQNLLANSDESRQALLSMAEDQIAVLDELRQANRRFEVAQKSAKAGTWDWDVVAGELVWSARMFELLGLDPEKCKATFDIWQKALHPDDATAAGLRVEEALKNHTFLNSDYRIVLPGGEVRWINAVGQGEYDAVGMPIRMLGLCIDITERKKMEEERLRMSEIMQNSERLESLGLLAGGIAHDFNNLLGGILGHVEMALESSTMDEAAVALVKVLSVMDQARGLTRQLLTFAKGGAPMRQVAPLFPFVGETAQMALRGTNVTCRLDVDEGLWFCSYDRTQVNQVVTNIIINAEQAMPLGGQITITARNDSIGTSDLVKLQPGRYVRISIADTGIGIPQEIIQRIFDPFFTTKQKGSGLGLAISYSVMQKHGGTIAVESVPGKGSTFHLYLPASDEVAAPVTSSSAGPVPMGSGAVLVMDDEEYMRQAVGMMLGRLGYTPVYADGCEAAVKEVRKALDGGAPLVAALLDLTIPGGKGGEDVLKEIRKIDPYVPAIAASGYAESPILSKPEEHDFAAGLVKPYRKEDLGRTLARVARKPANAK